LVQAWPSVERDLEFGQVLRASTAALAARPRDAGELTRRWSPSVQGPR
jgi:hypothetical protein